MILSGRNLERAQLGCSFLMLSGQLGWLRLKNTPPRLLLYSHVCVLVGTVEGWIQMGLSPSLHSSGPLHMISVAELSDSYVMVQGFKTSRRKLTVLLKDTLRTTYSLDLSSYSPIHKSRGEVNRPHLSIEVCKKCMAIINNPASRTLHLDIKKQNKTINKSW